MRLWGAAMVRNEADIVEAFVRHNLTVLDGMVIVDHASSDATSRILAALGGERLPIVVKRSDHPGYLQAELMTGITREAFAHGRADVVFPLDADEFLRVPSRAALEAAIAALPIGHIGRASWPTYVPDLAPGPADIAARLRGARRWPAPLPLPDVMAGKAVVTSAFAITPAATLRMGNHGVMLGHDPAVAPVVPHVDLPPSVVEVCHVPIRSVPQFVVKMTVKRLARVAAGRDYLDGSPMREAVDAIRRGDALTPATMLRTPALVDAASLDDAFAAPASRDDRFLADIALRYTPAADDDAMPVVLAAVDGLVRRADKARGARAR